MSFFDDKQEILKIELTTYGRYLISRGKFRPVYYAFFDDDILYDSQYGGLEETQNNVQIRILDESLSLKPQTTFTSIEDTVKLNTLLPSEVEKLKQEESQNIADKNYALSLPLGNSSNISDYIPAWSLQLLNGTINNIEYTLNNSAGDKEVLQPFIKYPQIELQNAVYDIKRKKDGFLDEGYKNIALYRKPFPREERLNYYINNPWAARGTTANSIELALQEEERRWNADPNNSYYYSVKDQPLIFDIEEKNVDDLTKNFDIEVFMESEEIQKDGSSIKIFKQLNMKKDPISILNGILLDQPITFDIEEDESFVEYHFELTFDDEISLPQKQNIQIPEAGINKPPFGNNC